MPQRRSRIERSTSPRRAGVPASRDPVDPARYLELSGDATIGDCGFAERVGKKYDADLRAYDAPGTSRVVVTINPIRVNAVDMSVH